MSIGLHIRRNWRRASEAERCDYVADLYLGDALEARGQDVLRRAVRRGYGGGRGVLH